MRSHRFIVFVLGLCSSISACNNRSVSPQATAKGPVTLVCGDAEARNEECTKLADVFAVDTPKIFASYTTYDIPKVGTKIHIDWVADDVGKQAPPKTVITSLDVDVTSATLLGGQHGNYYTAKTSLSKPTSGWPTGKYHVEFEFDGKTVSTVGFQINPAPTPAK